MCIATDAVVYTIQTLPVLLPHPLACTWAFAGCRYAFCACTLCAVPDWQCGMTTVLRQITASTTQWHQTMCLGCETAKTNEGNLLMFRQRAKELGASVMLMVVLQGNTNHCSWML